MANSSYCDCGNSQTKSVGPMKPTSVMDEWIFQLNQNTRNFHERDMSVTVCDLEGGRRRVEYPVPSKVIIAKIMR